jgi:hypothetical protein
VLRAAFRRSFGAALDGGDGVFFVDAAASFDHGLLGMKGKYLVFGAPESRDRGSCSLWPLLGVAPDSTISSLAGTDACGACKPDVHHTESEGFVHYAAHELTRCLPTTSRRRPFTRFDFQDEWNNLGFGRIRTDGSPWAVRGGLRADGATELAGCHVRRGVGEDYLGAYLCLFDTPRASILWCSRPLGPLDSTEWTVVERFVSDWRADELPCLPVLSQVPWGSSAIVTMRLDCDEDISSARDLFEWYESRRMPFSLAVKTGLPMTPGHLALLRDVVHSGGTLLSHSHTHPADWGRCRAEALTEAVTSREWFRHELPEAPLPELAVSPFHSNPPYAMQALEEAGFSGVVSGIIRNDPEYLMGRAGYAPHTRNLVSVSQQSMLHGDCYAQQGESVETHLRAFAAQHAAGGIFGYLDHPFSERYSYGWRDAPQRLEAHRKLVSAMRGFDGVLFLNQKACFDWVRLLNRIGLFLDGDEVRAFNLPRAGEFRVSCRFRGQDVPLGEMHRTS